METTIPYGRQDISEEDIDAIVEVLKSDFLTQGPKVPAFEKAVADYCGVDHAVASNSATSALHTACLALGVGPGDLVWTSPTTFVASSNCALYCGADVDFVDIDPRSYNISIERLSEKLALARVEGNLPKVVIPVHLCGQSCDMAAIYALGQEYGFSIIEDASHAIGGRYRDEVVGSCRYSDITVFSFHPVKIVTTGEGGMALTRNAQLARKLIYFRSHGITSDKQEMDARPDDEIWNYQQVALGFNYRMTDIHAVLGISQMKRLDAFVSRRNEIAKRYDEAFVDLAVDTPLVAPEVYSSFHLYVVCLQQNKCIKTQREVYNALREAGILVNLHYIPVYRQPYYEKLGFKPGYCPKAEDYHKSTISLPMFPALSNEQQDRVIDQFKSIVSQ